jgi:hypothetical protein
MAGSGQPVWTTAITDALITLGTTLQDVLDPVAADDLVQSGSAPGGSS